MFIKWETIVLKNVQGYVENQVYVVARMFEADTGT